MVVTYGQAPEPSSTYRQSGLATTIWLPAGHFSGGKNSYWANGPGRALLPEARSARSSRRPRYQGPSARRQSVDSPTAGSLAPAGAPMFESHAAWAGDPPDVHRSSASPPSGDASEWGSQAWRWTTASAHGADAGWQRQGKAGPRRLSRTACLAPKDPQSVPQHDDLQLVPLVWPHAEGNELKQPSKQ